MTGDGSGSGFKSGSGNLDFGDDSESEESQDERPDFVDESESDESTTESQDDHGRREADSSKTTTSSAPRDTGIGGTLTGGSSEKYPYFIRRSKVMDERVNRLEVHVRDKVKERESEFRNELANILGTDEVSKTDAREMAQLAAYNNPEIVAELMQDEGYGELD